MGDLDTSLELLRRVLAKLAGKHWAAKCVQDAQEIQV